MDLRIFKERTKTLGLAILRWVDGLPRRLTRQAPSDVMAKPAIVEEEAGESMYWLELLVESGILRGDTGDPLIQEANESVAMTVASTKTLRAKSGGRDSGYRTSKI